MKWGVSLAIQKRIEVINCNNFTEDTGFVASHSNYFKVFLIDAAMETDIWMTFSFAWGNKGFGRWGSGVEEMKQFIQFLITCILAEKRFHKVASFVKN